MVKNIILFVLIVSSGIVKGQNIIVDEVVAVVGNKEVLLSDIEKNYKQMMLQRIPFSGDLKCQIFEDLLIEKLLLNQAQIDSIEVSDMEVEMEMNNRLNYYIGQIGGEKELEEYYDMSLVQIKDDLREDLRDMLITQQMKMNIIGDLRVTPSEVKNFYKSIPEDSIPLIEGQVEYYQILLNPPFNEDAELEVRQKLLDLRERILNGERFSKLAALHSEGPSAPMGGDIGFSSRTDLDPEYAKAAFALQEGAVSKIVESAFGYHLIQMVERKGDMIRTRHILMKPKVSPEQISAALSKLDSIAELIKNDSLKFEGAARKYSEDKETRVNGGQVVNPVSGNALFEIQDLPQMDYGVLKNLQINEVSKPFMTRDLNEKVVFKIVMLKRQIEPHRANLEYDFPLISQMTKQQKQQEMLFKYLEEKQKTTYIRLKGSFENCDFQLKL